MKTKRKIHARDPILEAYMAEIFKIPLLHAEEERDLLARARTGDRDATNSIVSANLRFVVALSWKYRKRGLPLPDLINEGNLALFRAVEGFEPRENLRFMSYAVWWIRQGILSALARQAGSITYPPNRVYQVIRMRHIENRLTQRLGRAPAWDEIDAELGGGLADHGRLFRDIGRHELFPRILGTIPGYRQADAFRRRGWSRSIG